MDVTLSIAGVMLVMKKSQTGNTVSYHTTLSRSAYSQIRGSVLGLAGRAYLNLIEGVFYLHGGKSYIEVVDKSLVEVLTKELQLQEID